MSALLKDMESVYERVKELESQKLILWEKVDDISIFAVHPVYINQCVYCGKKKIFE